MKKRPLWLTWYSLYILCALLGFIPEPTGFWKLVCVTAAILFFVPGWLLIKWANDRGDTKTLRQIRTISICSLALTMMLIILNMASVLMSAAWGKALYILLILGSSPMICAGYWSLSLFGWACLMVTTFYLSKKK